MKTKLFNLLLILTSLFGYLEWGMDNAAFLFEVEFQLLTKLPQDPMALLHPFTLIPLLGQIFLLITLFQKKPNKLLTYAGMASLGLLLGFLCFVGIMASNAKISLSALPFLLVAVLAIRYHLFIVGSIVGQETNNVQTNNVQTNNEQTNNGE